MRDTAKTILNMPGNCARALEPNEMNGLVRSLNLTEKHDAFTHVIEHMGVVCRYEIGNLPA